MNSKQCMIIGLLFLITVPIVAFAAIPAYPSSSPASSGSSTEPGVPGITTPLGLVPERPAYPDISGNLIVYQDNRTGNWDIFLYNLTTEQEVQLTSDDADQQFPAIDGDLVVWQENRNGQWELVMYALNSSCPSWSKPIEECPAPKATLPPAGMVCDCPVKKISQACCCQYNPSPSNTPKYPPTGPTTATPTPTMNATNVTNATLIVDFTFTPSPGYINYLMNFTDTTKGGSTPYQWTWDFGDGSQSSNQQNPDHAFMNPGNYSVNLTVTDSGGIRNSTAKDVEVINPNNITVTPLIVDFSINPFPGFVDQPVNFTDLTTGGLKPYQWTWTLDDGSPPTNQQDFDHVFTAANNYTANLTVRDFFGSTNSTDKPVPIVNETTMPIQMFTVDFNYQPSPARPNTPVQFGDAITNGRGTLTYAWDFESDGVIDNTTSNPVHTFPSEGNYMVKLAVNDSGDPPMYPPAYAERTKTVPVFNFTPPRVVDENLPNISEVAPEAETGTPTPTATEPLRGVVGEGTLPNVSEVAPGTETATPTPTVPPTPRPGLIGVSDTNLSVNAPTETTPPPQTLRPVFITPTTEENGNSGDEGG